MYAILKGLVLAVSLSLLMSDLSYSQPVSFISWNFRHRYIRHRDFLGYVEEIHDKIGEKDATFKLVPGLAGKGTSFESVNYPGYFLRHENFRLKLAKLTDTKLFREDATFYFVPGLASSEAVSFESFNFPKHYIRHFNFELWVNPFDGSDVFRKDATFIRLPPAGETIDPGTNQVPVSE
jgi:hypothetical protein